MLQTSSIIFVVAFGVRDDFRIRVRVRIRVTLLVNAVIFTAPVRVGVWVRCLKMK